MKILSSGNLEAITEQFVRNGRFQGVRQAELPFLTNAGKKKLEELLKVLMSQKRIAQYDKEQGILIHADFLEKAREEIVKTITQYHQDFPLKVGVQKEELRSRTIGSPNQKLFNVIINQLTNEGIIVQDKEVLRLKGHKVTLAQDQEKTRHQIEEIYLKVGLKPPYFRELKGQLSGDSGSDVLQVMVKNGLLVKVKEDLYFHHKAIDDLRIKLISFLKDSGEIDTGQFKEMTGVSRKYAIPLMEYFDKTQLTVRVGDNRVLRKK